MYKFFLFLKSIYTVLLFIVLEIVAGYMFFGNSPYQRAAAINASNRVMGAVYQKSSSVVEFFGLSAENERLANENAELRRLLSRVAVIDTIEQATITEHTYIAARVINNSIAAQNNFIVINKGRKDGVERDMALLNNDGIVGYVLDCSENFSVAISVLNHRDFKTSGKIKGSDNTGSISWNGLNYRVVQLTQLPKYSKINVGDTINTTEYSNIFPSDYPIGRVLSFVIDNGTTINAEVELFADMSKLRYVYAVQNPLQSERAQLESKNIRR